MGKAKLLREYTEQSMMLAVAEVSSGSGLRKTAQKYNIPYSTLNRGHSLHQK